MNKVEFLTKLENINTAFSNISISDAEYQQIEYVYNWHPCIDEVRGKEQIAYLYAEFGIRIIHDMLPTAVEARNAEHDMKKAKAEYESAVARYEKFKQGTR